MIKICYCSWLLENKPWKFSSGLWKSRKNRQITGTGKLWMMQTWDQYDKKTVRFQPKAENLPQSKYMPSQKWSWPQKRRKKWTIMQGSHSPWFWKFIDLYTQLKRNRSSNLKKNKTIYEKENASYEKYIKLPCLCSM